MFLYVLLYFMVVRIQLLLHKCEGEAEVLVVLGFIAFLFFSSLLSWPPFWAGNLIKPDQPWKADSQYQIYKTPDWRGFSISSAFIRYGLMTSCNLWVISAVRLKICVSEKESGLFVSLFICLFGGFFGYWHKCITACFYPTLLLNHGLAWW